MRGDSSALSHLSPHILGAVALAWATASLFWSSGPWGVPALWLAICAITYILGVFLPPRPVWLTLCGFLCLNGVFALFDYYRLGVPSYGIFGNPNFFGCALALGIAAALGYRFRWAFVALVPLLLWTQSRGAIAAAGVAGILAAWRRSRPLALLGIAGTFAAIAAIRPHDNAVAIRLGVWQDTFDHLTLFGHGFGSFLVNYSTWPVHRNLFVEQAPHPYNDALELLFELGIGSVIVWFWLALCLATADFTSRLIATAFAVTSLTFFPFWVTGPLFTLTLGTTTRLRNA